MARPGVRKSSMLRRTVDPLLRLPASDATEAKADSSAVVAQPVRSSMPLQEVLTATSRNCYCLKILSFHLSDSSCK